MTTILDCTLRDGGYYNSWDFPRELVNQYLVAMEQIGVNVVELGFRSIVNNKFNGAHAYTTDSYIKTLSIPEKLKIGIMINGSELKDMSTQQAVIKNLMPEPQEFSRVDIVRIACHVSDFLKVLPVTDTLKQLGYTVGFNLMQIADISDEEIESLAKIATQYDIDVLYFADSMGSLKPNRTKKIIELIRKYWNKDIGIHTHDNMGLALSNTLIAYESGANWLDSTVTGMGRGPGNARTEELAIEISEKNNNKINLVPLMKLIQNYFQPLKIISGWGSNPYYFLAGKFGIHPSYVQEMLSDTRYSNEDILIAIERLKINGGKNFNLNTLYGSTVIKAPNLDKNWNPELILSNRDVLILGTGPGVERYNHAIEEYIKSNKPVVIALNAQSAISQELIDYRIACHPLRLLADIDSYHTLPQKIITSISLLENDILNGFHEDKFLNYGLIVQNDTFLFEKNYSIIPNSMVISYALATVTAGRANKIILAGFDGYAADDPRNSEMNKIFRLYAEQNNALDIISITPTRYEINTKSIYGLI